MKLGIDFGTCFSFIATCTGQKDDSPYPLVGSNDDDIYDNGGGIPTVFYNDEQDARYNEIMGKKAADMRRLIPNNGVAEIKKMLQGNCSLDISYTLGGKRYTVKDIGVKLLKLLIDKAVENFIRQFPRFNSNLESIVIAVPVKSLHWYRKFIRDSAAEASGLTVDKIKLIPEPVAAAFSYFGNAPDLSDGTRILVYDLGGGTFDTAIVEYDSSHWRKFNVIAQSGANGVGGTDWDRELLKHIKIESGHTETKFSAQDECKLENDVIAAKIRLSTTEKDDVIRFSCYADDANVVLKTSGLTQRKFEELTKKYLDRTMSVVDDLIKEYRGKYGNDAKIDAIVLTGGATRMPMVSERLVEEYPGTKILSERPDRAIAFGAAIYAASEIPPLMLAPHTYGIQCRDKTLSSTNSEEKKIRNILFRGNQLWDEHSGEEYISYKEKEPFTPSHPNQKAATVRVYESDDCSTWSKLDDRKLIFSFPITFEELPGKKMTERKYGIEIRIISSGILEVYVYDRDQNNKPVGFDRSDL